MRQCCKRCLNFVYVKRTLNSREYFNEHNVNCLGEILLRNARYFFAIKPCMCGNGMGIQLHFGTRCQCGGDCITDPYCILGIYRGSIFYTLG